MIKKKYKPALGTQEMAMSDTDFGAVLRDRQMSDVPSKSFGRSRRNR